MVQPSDEALAARVAQKDVAAFTELYDRHARAVYAMAAHMLGQSDAEEIVQDVFLRLWNKAEQFDSVRGAFGGWFMTVARNRVFDELERRGKEHRWSRAEEIDKLLAAVQDPKVDVEEEVWLRERGSALRRALSKLPDEQRRVLVLAYFGGLSQTAMAEYLGWPLGTVKKRTRLGLQKLRTALAEEGLQAEPQSSQLAGA